MIQTINILRRDKFIMNKAKKSKRLKKDLKIEKNLEERFNETFPNHTKRFGNEVIEQVNVADANLQYTKIFGANKME